MRTISIMVAAVGIVVSIFLYVGGLSWLVENNNYQNPGNWFLAAIALLLLCKEIERAFKES